MRAIYFAMMLLMPAVLAQHLVINEVSYDPAGTDTGYEFVELYNPTNQTLSLEGYLLESGNGAGRMIGLRSGQALLQIRLRRMVISSSAKSLSSLSRMLSQHLTCRTVLTLCA